MAEVAALKEAGPGLDAAQGEAAKALDARLAAIPNRPKADVPEGADEHGNVEYRSHASTRERLSEGKEHFELGEAMGHGFRDRRQALRLALRGAEGGQLARLERALGQFMLDLHTQEHGYTEVAPPIMVRDEAMFARRNCRSSRTTSSRCSMARPCAGPLPASSPAAGSSPRRKCR